MRRGAKLWYVLASILWLDFHRVVLNTLLLDYALYDFCLTKTQFLDACRRLPLIAIAKLALICVDRFASHVQNTETGSLSSTCFLQEMLIHQYLQSYTDTVEMGQFLHLLSVTVPESVTYGYKPAFQLVHCFNTIILSVFMALFLPMLKGEAPSLETIQPLIWILVPLHWTFVVGLWMRRPSFNHLAARARDADIEKNRAMIDLLYCREWLRCYDAAYPVQHVRRAFDEACSYACLHLGNLMIYQGDTQWVARYFGELTKIFGVLFGGYAAIDFLHSGKGTMTLGRFTVFLSLYSIIIDVIYMFIEAWDGLSYAGVLVEELCQMANAPSRCSAAMQPFELEEHPIISGEFVMKLSSSEFSLTSQPGPILDVTLGYCYAIRTYSDASSLRRRACEVLGGLRSTPQLLGCVKVLLLKPPVTLATGSVLENLLSNAAAWVRASDVIALVAALGIPIPAPAGVRLLDSYKHGANSLDLNRALESAAGVGASQGRHLQEHCERFVERCFASNFSILSSIAEAEDLLQPVEKALFDLARGLLADPEILVAHDMLNAMPRSLAQNALQVMVLWQRLGGFKGMVLAFEENFSRPKGYPNWLGAAGGVCRSLFLSESETVCAGLRMRSHVDRWFLIQPGGTLELCSAEELSADEQSPTLSLARKATRQG